MKKLGFLVLLMLAASPVAAQDASPAPTADEAAGFGTGEEASAAAEDAAAAETDAVAAEADAAQAEGDAAVAEADAAAAEAESTAEAATDAAATDAAAVDAAAEATAADVAAEAPADAAAPVEEAVSVEETVEVTEEVAEESTDSAAVEEESEPWQLYVGTDYVWTRARFSSDALKAEFGGDDFDSDMVRARVGVRLFESIGAELHLGAGTGNADDLEAGDYNTERFFGAYLVPTGVLFDLIEVGAAIGYANTKLETATASETLSGVSFGVNIEVPLYASEAVELRIGGGGTMFRAQNSAQISGYHAGIRVDFKL